MRSGAAKAIRREGSISATRNDFMRCKFAELVQIPEGIAVRILFLHGWQSIVGGRKPTFLKENGHEVINPALPDDDFDESVRIAEAEFQKHQPDVIVGSSRGGAVAIDIHSGGTPLVLLCPAWKNWGKATTVKSNTIILHSRQDDVIPFTDSEELLANSGLSAESLWEIGDDHRLAADKPLQAMLAACQRLTSTRASILDDPAISGRYLFPQNRFVENPCLVETEGVRLACHHKIIDSDAFTLVHFHGNGEAVADYVPFMADAFADIGLNSLFVEYREYGGSTGKAQLVAMLGDGEAAMATVGVSPEKAIAFGRSIGSLYAIELAARQPSIAGLVIESGIADPAERFLTHADLAGAGIDEADVYEEVERHFDHKKKLSAFRNRLLILHAEVDGLIDISHAERNHAWAASTHKRFVRFSQGNHNTIFRANLAEYLEVLKEFVEAVQE